MLVEWGGRVTLVPGTLPFPREIFLVVLPATNAGFVFTLFTAVDLLRVLCSSNSFAFYYLVLSASLNATAFAIFLICCCLLFKQPKKLKFFPPCFITFPLKQTKSNPPICYYSPVSNF